MELVSPADQLPGSRRPRLRHALVDDGLAIELPGIQVVSARVHDQGVLLAVPIVVAYCSIPRGAFE